MEDSEPQYQMIMKLRGKMVSSFNRFIMVVWYLTSRDAVGVKCLPSKNYPPDSPRKRIPRGKEPFPNQVWRIFQHNASWDLQMHRCSKVIKHCVCGGKWASKKGANQSIPGKPIVLLIWYVHTKYTDTYKNNNYNDYKYIHMYMHIHMYIYVYLSVCL